MTEAGDASANVQTKEPKKDAAFTHLCVCAVSLNGARLILARGN